MVVFNLGDGGAVELDPEPRELAREGVLGDRRVGQGARFSDSPSDDVLASRTSGHKNERSFRTKLGVF